MAVLTEKDADRTVDAAVGDTIEIRLPENPTTGYRWKFETPDKAACEVIADDYIAPEKPTPGAPGEHVWRVKARQPGEYALAIASRRRWESAGQPARLFKLTLRVRA